MLDDALNVVLVVLVDGGLPFNVVDDEGSGVFQDLLVLICEHHVRLAGGCRARTITALMTNASFFCALLLTLERRKKEFNKELVRKIKVVHCKNTKYTNKYT